MKEEVLIEITPTTKLLHDAIDLVPDYGFINNAEQRRNALHNKVYAVEKMLRNKNKQGAKKSLLNEHLFSKTQIFKYFIRLLILKTAKEHRDFN